MVAWRKCALIAAASVTACAHFGGARSSAAPGRYWFNDLMPGVGYVSGSFEVGANGRVTSFSGGCTQSPASALSAGFAQCRIAQLSVAGKDGRAVQRVAVRLVVTETTPSPTNPTSTQTSYRTFNGTLAAH